jgi:GR25 family glycosyltransferase involved in LPS biosynthesis
MKVPRFEACPSSSTCEYCQSKSGAALWKGLKHVYCICLQDRPDRFAQVVTEFHKNGLCQQVIIYQNVRPSKQLQKIMDIHDLSAYGCWEAHRSVMEKAIDDGAEHATIFEDDVIFTNSVIGTQGQIAAKIRELPFDWEIFYLGHTPIIGVPTWFSRISRTMSGMTHAYIANRSLMTKLIQTPYISQPKFTFVRNEYGIDIFYMFRTKQYALIPMIAKQRNSQSDIPKKGIFKTLSEYFVSHHESWANFFEINAYVLLPAILVFLTWTLSKRMARRFF